MPICTSCTHQTPYLYTVYESAYNLRLEQCVSALRALCKPSSPSTLTLTRAVPQPACGAFADPYVEHDTLTLLIDLILLKRDVYRHLLFNRGLGERKAGAETAGMSADAEAKRERVCLL